jgi:hypothetical protein
MSVELRLDALWVPDEPVRAGDVVLSRGDNALVYGGSLSVPVRRVDPASVLTVEQLIDAVRAADGPDRVVLAAGHVPTGWRARLRQAGVSFACDDGTVEIFTTDIKWPGPGDAAAPPAEPDSPLTGPDGRRPEAAGRISLRNPHLPVLQELVSAAMRGQQLAYAELAGRAGTAQIFADETVAELEAHGYVVRRRDSSRRVSVVVGDVSALAGVLARQSAWPGSKPTIAVGYLWGRNRWDMAASLSRNAAAVGVKIAVTGRAGAAFHGVSGPSPRIQVRCWAAAGRRTFATIAELLGLEKVQPEEANVLVAADWWGLGTGGATTIRSGKWEASIAQPVRVWCDLRGEDAGRALAAELWEKTSTIG